MLDLSQFFVRQRRARQVPQCIQQQRGRHIQAVRRKFLQIDILHAGEHLRGVIPTGVGHSRWHFGVRAR
ncbi:hypothetical protein D3C86_1820520 [compost metagenome]